MQEDWSKYGQWRHPLIWWGIQLKRYLLQYEPEIIKLNPAVIKVEDERIIFKFGNEERKIRKEIFLINARKNNRSNKKEEDK